jgi:EpsD family peptidyl-prolyl cis-trans isomerase
MFMANPYPNRNICGRASALVMMLAIAGCSRHSGGQAVVSGAGGFEVPRAEFEQAQATAASNGIHAPPSAILQQVVDQKLFADEARREKLDRDLGVVQSIEAAKRSILASAYAQRLVKALAPPSDSAITDFYNSHPELFSARNVVSLEDIGVSGDPAEIAELKKQFSASGGKLEVLQAILARRGVTAPVVHTERSPDEVDMAAAAAFSRLKVGDSFVYQSPKDTHFAVVTAVQSAPLSLAQAEPQIRKLLVNQAQRELINKEAARLKGAADLIYAKGYGPAAPAGH